MGKIIEQNMSFLPDINTKKIKVTVFGRKFEDEAYKKQAICEFELCNSPYECYLELEELGEHESVLD